MDNMKTFLNGLLKENPTLVMMLGMCPTLAVTTLAVNGIGMGLATTFVLICSNMMISAVGKIIPPQIRLPAYIVMIAGLVTVCGFAMKYYFPVLDEALGVYIPLITVNCIIFGRAEAFANKNKIVKSAFDGLGMGLGFTGALILIGSIREILGYGTWMGIKLYADIITPMSVFVLPAGGFVVLGIVIAVFNKLTKNGSIKNARSGCEGCPAAEKCGKAL